MATFTPRKIAACVLCRDWAPTRRYGSGSPVKYCDPCRGGNTDKKRRYAYGLERSDLYAMQWEQQECCAACGQISDALLIDHDHETGKVRGLLCNLCNMRVGCAERLEVREYLGRFYSPAG